MTQYLLFCSKIPNTLSDVQESIKSDVRPQDAVLRGTEVENSLSNQFGEDDNNVSKSNSGKNIAKSTCGISIISNFNLKPSVKLSGSNICGGVMAGNEFFQVSISLYIQCCYVPH